MEALTGCEAELESETLCGESHYSKRHAMILISYFKM